MHYAPANVKFQIPDITHTAGIRGRIVRWDSSTNAPAGNFGVLPDTPIASLGSPDPDGNYIVSLSLFVTGGSPNPGPSDGTPLRVGITPFNADGAGGEAFSATYTSAAVPDVPAPVSNVSVS